MYVYNYSMNKKIVYCITRYELTFDDGLKLQEDLFIKNRAEETDYLIITTHPHTITFGKLEDGQNLLYPENYFRERGIPIFRIDRGGKVTYHGPGQLILYPIINILRFNLTIREYVYKLEEVIINLLLRFNITAFRNHKERIGIWTSECKKIASIGIRVRNNISLHGIALNVDPDLDYFKLINPCGLPSTLITSMKRVSGLTYSMDELSEVFVREFEKIFCCQITIL